MEVRVLLILAGGAAALWAFARWRLAVQAVLVLLVVEGAIRKWLVPGAQDLVYFAKDVLLLAAYLGFWVHRRRLRDQPAYLPALWLALGTGAAYGLAEVFNPRLPSVLVGLLGFKAYFWYVPLLLVVPAVFPTDAALFRFLRRYILLTVPVGLLAGLQFLSPASSALNTYARAAKETGYIATFGSSTHVRVTGTFSYISGYTSYLIVTTIFLLALLAVVRWRWRGQLGLYIALTMTVLGMLMTGSRGPVFLLAILFPIYWLLAVARERERGAMIGRQVLVLGLLAMFLGYAAPGAYEAFRGRAAGSEDVRGRAVAPFLLPLKVMDQAGFTGFGIGSTHQAAVVVVKHAPPYSWLRGNLIEAESGKVMLELGPLGFVLIYFPRLYLMIFAFGQVFRLRTRFHRAVAIASFLLFLALLPGSVVFDPTMGVYYWFIAGLLMTVMKLDRIELATTNHQVVSAVGPASAAPAERVKGRGGLAPAAASTVGRKGAAWQR